MSVGYGLPLLIQTHDWTLPASSKSDISGISDIDVSLKWQLRIEHFRHRVSSYLTSHVLEPGPTGSMLERTTIYSLLNSELTEMVRDEENPAGKTLSPTCVTVKVEDNIYPDLATWHLAAARLHLHTFYLFDDATSKDYQDRIVSLYLTAYSLVELSLEFDARESGFLHYCPFSCYQAFVCAAFVILKILMNGFFRTILDIGSGTKLLEAAIAALRKMSVVNNDLPARLGDVIGYFCAVSDPTVVGGVTISDLRLRQVQSRMSMSVVYDCLRTWRRDFQTGTDEVGGGTYSGTRDKLHDCPFRTHVLT